MGPVLVSQSSNLCKGVVLGEVNGAYTFKLEAVFIDNVVDFLSVIEDVKRLRHGSFFCIVLEIARISLERDYRRARKLIDLLADKFIPGSVHLDLHDHLCSALSLREVYLLVIASYKVSFDHGVVWAQFVPSLLWLIQNGRSDDVVELHNQAVVCVRAHLLGYKLDTSDLIRFKLSVLPL